MATVIYDGREYEMATQDVHAFKEAASMAAVGGAEWLVLATPTGTVSLFVTAGVNIAIVTE